MRRAPCVIAIVLGVLAQGFPSPSAAEVRAGLKGGVTLADLTGDDVFNNSTSLGGTGGVFARFALSQKFSLQPEVLYSLKGAEYKVGDLETEQKIDCIDVPILLYLAWPNESKFKPGFFAGPAIDFLLTNKIADGQEIDLTDDTKSTSYSLVVGAGLDYTLGEGAALFDVRYEWGLTSWMEDTDVKNSVVSIMIGYGKKF